MSASRTQIIATIGPASASPETLRQMVERHADAVRLNFSWTDLKNAAARIAHVRDIGKELGRRIPVIADLPGPRIENAGGHSYDPRAASAITEKDREIIAFAVEHGADYVAVSFVGSEKDIEACRREIVAAGGTQRVIAKIERAAAVENLDGIIAAADALMVARGDLGAEVPLERIPFIQEDIIGRCKAAGKPVITATQMLISMTEHLQPTRAEVTDVANAVIEGSDAIMLSDETAAGKHPVEAVAMMEAIALETERHMGKDAKTNPL
jgi:pyruvate kinase